MEKINVRDCYRCLKESGFHMDPSWTGQFPMFLLSPAARAFIHSVYCAQGGNADRALGFSVLARVLATEEEGPCVIYLHSMSEFLAGNTREAIDIAMEAKEAARARSDDELEADVLAHLADMYRAAGDTQAAQEYKEEADRMREVLACRQTGEAYGPGSRTRSWKCLWRQSHEGGKRG
jgi:tetratricopeptide (TPR) repeat protein